MQLHSRYVLFYCDDCDLLKPAIETFMTVHKFYTVLTSSDETDFLHKIETYRPELLLMYLHNPAKDYMSLVKTIRERSPSEDVPILIYKQLPDAAELVDAFQKMKKFI